ncbi:hypothetical protein [Flindersiella endophytica]
MRPLTAVSLPFVQVAPSSVETSRLAWLILPVSAPGAASNVTSTSVTSPPSWLMSCASTFGASRAVHSGRTSRWPRGWFEWNLHVTWTWQSFPVLPSRREHFGHDVVDIISRDSATHVLADRLASSGCFMSKENPLLPRM